MQMLCWTSRPLAERCGATGMLARRRRSVNAKDEVRGWQRRLAAELVRVRGQFDTAGTAVRVV